MIPGSHFFAWWWVEYQLQKLQFPLRFCRPAIDVMPWSERSQGEKKNERPRRQRLRRRRRSEHRSRSRRRRPRRPKMPRREEERPERRNARGKRRREKTFKERFQDWISGECDGVGRFWWVFSLVKMSRIWGYQLPCWCNLSKPHCICFRPRRRILIVRSICKFSFFETKLAIVIPFMGGFLG